MGAIRSIVAETFHVLLIASDVAPAHATTFRGYFPEPEAAGWLHTCGDLRMDANAYIIFNSI